MYLIKKEHIINSDKLSRDITIVNTADYHFSNISSKRKFIVVKNDIFQVQPNYICITGDYIDMPEILDNPIMYDESLSYIEELSKIAPVFFSIGSHEYVRKDRSIYYNKNWFSDLDGIDNVHLLNNKRYDIDDVSFYGYTPIKSYYNSSHTFKGESKLIIDFTKKMPELENDLYTVLLCHSPVDILKDYVVNNINGFKNIDVILSGHMHNGMMFNFMDSIIPGHSGIISPDKRLFPTDARGMICKEVDGKKIYLNITGGVTKIQETAPRILHFADKLYRPQIDCIKIKSLKS